MLHPEVLLVPVLMVLDYYLTLYGAHLAEQSYRRHFKTEHYELNPIWQRAVARRRWINLWHLGGRRTCVPGGGPGTGERVAKPLAWPRSHLQWPGAGAPPVQHIDVSSSRSPA